MLCSSNKNSYCTIIIIIWWHLSVLHYLNLYYYYRAVVLLVLPRNFSYSMKRNYLNSIKSVLVGGNYVISVKTFFLNIRVLSCRWSHEDLWTAARPSVSFKSSIVNERFILFVPTNYWCYTFTQDITDGPNYVLQLIGGSDLKTPYSTVYDSDRCIFLHPWSDFFFFFLNVLMQLPPLLMALVTSLLLIPLIDGREFTIRPPVHIVLRINNFMRWVNII